MPLSDMTSTAGILSFYLRLCNYVYSITPHFWKSSRKSQIVAKTVTWLNDNMLEHPHRQREMAQLKEQHRRLGSGNNFTDEIILVSLREVDDATE
jgi:hypothetical protein